MKIILAGGGSGGPVSPVLAVAGEIRKHKPHTEFLFIGTRSGPERAMVTAEKIKFVSIPAARLRRFWTIKNLMAPFVFIAGLVKSYLIVRKFQPDLIFSAGGFVAVPVSWMGRLLGAKVIIHQQDIRIGLANKLIAPLAAHITTAFEYTSKEFYSHSGLWKTKIVPRADWVGNPVRAGLLNPQAHALNFFKLHDSLPILLVLGGATGAAQINELLEEILPQLVQSFQVIHQTGTGKRKGNFSHPNYHPHELIPFPEYAAILKAAHIVITRAGLSTIAELSALGKAAIVIPMPRTHQEDNAKILVISSAAIVLMGQNLNSPVLLQAINDLKFKPQLGELISKNMQELMPHDAATAIAKIIFNYAKS